MIHRSQHWRGAALCLLLMTGLAACDSDDATTSPAVVAGADTLNVANGASADLLANDTIGGAPATAGAAGNVSFTITTGALPAGITATNGSLTVAAATVPGTFGFSYQVCEPGTSNCASAAVQITVPAPAIAAAADTFMLAAGGSGDVLANDTLGGAAATAATVTATATTALPTGLSLAGSGVLSVGAAATAGSYPIGYRICQNTAITNCATATATVTVTVPTVAQLTGRVVDASTGVGVAGAGVRAGAATATTDAGGNFSLSSAPAGGRVTVLFSLAGYVDSARIAALAASGSTNVQVRLLRIAATASVDPALGGTVTVTGSPAQFVVPANAVQRADGSAPTGALTVALTPIDPATDSAVMPGDFTTQVSGVLTPIESFGALNVTLTDAAGVPVDLRAGQTAALRIPLASRNASAPATIPLYYFDNASGTWVSAGTATLVGTGTGRYYQGTVSRVATWNVDQPYATVRVTGCLKDAAGTGLTGAQVATDGVDYSGTSSAITGTGGAFTVPMRKDSVATLTGVSIGRLTNTLRIGPFSTDTTLTDCLSLGQAGAGLTMKLTWGAQPRDLDSHLWTPNGIEIDYGNKGSLLAAPFANLDVDDTSSYGPEVVTLTRLMVGTYKYSIYNFSGYGAGSITASGARVELNVPGRSPELYAPPAGETSATNWWNLFEIDVDASCNVTVRRVGTFSNGQPAAPGSGTAVYCTAP